MVPRSTLARPILLVAVLALAGCGIKGPLVPPPPAASAPPAPAAVPPPVTPADIPSASPNANPEQKPPP